MKTIWTIGHSTHSWESFLELLRGAEIAQLADIRRFPGSRRHPQFNGSTMKTALEKASIDYQHFVALGGRRRERLPDSPNTAWRVDAFNAYADHTQSVDFLTALELLETSAMLQRTVVMCSEAVFWQCHRRVLADVFIARGWKVVDIFPNGQQRPHVLTEFAKIYDSTVTYPSLFSGTVSQKINS